MYKNNDIQTIGSLVESSIFAKGLDNDKMRSVIKHSTIFSFWSDIAGRKFENLSVPYAIKAGVLYVAVKSPVISQELLLNKKLLINKLNSYSLPLGIEIKDILFNYKKFDEFSSVKTDEFVEDKPVWFDEDELNKISLDTACEKEILASISKISFLNDLQKQNLIKKIILIKKAQKAQKIL